ncbi:MAG: hypothetical protein WC975_07495 [Phycisphaerae bacterium]
MDLRQISLVKGSQRYVFRYTPGNEPEIIDTFIDLADNVETEFDWFDAAVLSYQMGKQMQHQVEQAVEQTHT